MLRNRILFTLIYNNGFFTQSRNFRLQQVGDIHWLEKNYQFQKIAFSVDELVILNASRQPEPYIEFSKTVKRFRSNVFVPVSAGGGIRTMEDAEMLFQNGADKIVLNSILFTNAGLVKMLVNRYGSQSIIASIDYKKTNDHSEIYIENGSKKIGVSLIDYIHYVQNLKVGEIYLNSIDQDGTGFGYDIDTIQSCKEHVHTPFIIAGGAGNEAHLIEGLKIEGVNAVATANLFNFVGDGLSNAREKMLKLKINLPVFLGDFGVDSQWMISKK